MPVYEYEALTETGEHTRGVIDADTPREARLKLRGKKIHVTDMRAVADKGKARRREDGGGSGGEAPLSLLGYLTPRREMLTSALLGLQRRRAMGDIAMVTRQLATLLAAGIPLADAMTALIQQVSSRALEAALRQVKEDIQKGNSLAESLARHPHFFNELYVNMVRAGEASGSLDAVLKRLAEYMQQQNRMRNRISAALMYPFVMSVAGVAVVTFLVTYVVPKITKVLLKRGMPLPLPTRMLLGMKDFLVGFYPLILLGLFLAWVAYKAVLRTDRGRLLRDTYLLRIPVFGDLFRKQAVSRFAVTFSTLLKSGIQATECLRILRNVVDNRLLSNVLQVVHDRIVEGTDIATPLKSSGVFPPVVGYMIAIGEQSGQLEDILDRIAESYDEEIEITTQKVTSLIEPVIIVFMAVIVGFIVLSVVLPLVQGFKI